MIKRKINRLKDYDYSQEGYYFVTICAKDRFNYFGCIRNGEVVSNDLGKVVKEQWYWLGKQYSFIELDQFIVMPNHFHGIIIIKSNVGTGLDLSLPDRKILPLSNIIGAFKTTSSKIIHLTYDTSFHWQRSYYDHVIRNEKSLEKIRNYILYNPLKWEYDIENPQKRFSLKYQNEYYERLY